MHPYDEKASKCIEKLHGITQPDNEAGFLTNMIKSALQYSTKVYQSCSNYNGHLRRKDLNKQA
jgi:hypothetical protein